MNIVFKSFFRIFTIIILLSGFTFSQDIGKIFTDTEADKLFGEVLEQSVISIDELKGMLNSTEKFVMFKVSNEELTVLGDNRVLIFSTKNYAEVNEIFHKFSKSKVLELINKGFGNQVIVQKRKKVLTITYGAYTLELAMGCPPYCN